MVISVIWAASLLTYNVATEARKRQIPVTQTSIIQSAENRLSLDENFNEKYAGILDWGGFLKGQIDRLVRWSFPVWDYDGKYMAGRGCRVGDVSDHRRLWRYELM